jgi:hypothetical protein
MPNSTRAVELIFRPNRNLVSIVRKFVADFYEGIVLPTDLLEQVELTTHELLENAVKYASDDTTQVKVDLSDGTRGPAFLISTTNRATAEHREILGAAFKEMLTHPDPNAYYLELTARNCRSDSGSGLGLARIRAEADMDLALTIEGDTVMISATQTQRPPS